MNRLMLKIIDGIIVVSVVIGIGIDLSTSKTFYDKFNLFTYYTIQSNIFMMLLSLRSLVFGYNNKLYNILRVGGSLVITITGSVYHFLLSSIHNPTGLNAIANILLHYVVPSLSILSWVLFVKKTKLKWSTPFIWLIYPIVYFIGTMIRGYYSNVYPYWFVNPTRPRPDGVGSYSELFKVIVILAGVYALLGMLFTWVNNYLESRQR